jgi:hypothetical protein
MIELETQELKMWLDKIDNKLKCLIPSNECMMEGFICTLGG